MMRERGFGRIVNNTTSYLTMLRVLPYGAAKAALESMSAVWAKELEGGPITVNVLVPGGPTDTPLIADGSGWDRATRCCGRRSWGRRSAGSCRTRPPRSTASASPRRAGTRSLPPAEAAKRASRAIGWPELAADAVWLTA